MVCEVFDFFFFFILKFGTILQRKEKGGKREFKKTTNTKYNREKKETKKVLHFFLLWEVCETKEVLHLSVWVC